MKTKIASRLIGALLGASALCGGCPTYAADTIKIGVLLIDSGPLAGLKETQQKAVNLAIEQINAAGGAAGKMLEADFISYPGTPDTAVDGATRAVQKDGALFITGMDTSAVSPALSAKLAALNALMVEVYAQADALTGKNCSANYFRANVNDSMLMNAAGQFLKEKNLKKWDILAVDYSSGRDAADFGAKISELGADPADGLYVVIFGSDAINLAKQQAQFGLFSKYKLVLGNSFIIPQVLPAMGDTAVGVYQTLGFVPGEPGAGPEAFVKAYKEKYNGQSPAYTSADQYAAIQLMAAAINKANSTDVAAVRSALAGLKADTVLGPVEVRAADHQTARPILMNQIVKNADGTAGYRIEQVYPGDTLLPPVDHACKM